MATLKTTNIQHPDSPTPQIALSASGMTFSASALELTGGAINLPAGTSIGNVSSTELGYLDGVTSALQTQLSNRVLTTGGSTITAANASTVGLTVKGASGQTADLIRASNSSDTDLFRVEDDGLISGSGPSLGAWTTFTPAKSGFVLGNGNELHQYLKIGKLIIVGGKLAFGSTSTFSGQFGLTMPFTTADQSMYVGTFYANDAGSTATAGVSVFTSSTVIGFLTGVLNAVLVGTTVPFTWGNGDNFRYTIMYQEL
jgi:hypothetical protein